jgi:hypothetical protein
MNGPLFISNRCITSIFLVSGLLTSLSLSSGTGLRWVAQASGLEGRSEPSSIHSAAAFLRADALTNSQNARSEPQVSRHNRARHPTAHSAVVTARFRALNAVAEQFSLSRDAGVAYACICFSRPRGRAPPQSA